MNVLAIETSTTRASLAVFRERQLVSHALLPTDEKTATSLFTAIEKALHESGIRPAEIDLIAVSTGPGSFTGLRIGVTFAKAFAYATDARIAAIPTPLALAYGALCKLDSTHQTAEVVIDAQRQQVFVQSFRLNEHNWPEATTGIQLVQRSDWWTQQHPCDCVTGPGLDVLEKSHPVAPSDEAEPNHAIDPFPHILDEPDRQPNAVHVGQVAIQFGIEGETLTWLELKPEYGRPSAAEEKSGRR